MVWKDYTNADVRKHVPPSGWGLKGNRKADARNPSSPRLRRTWHVPPSVWVLNAHRELIFGKRAADSSLPEMSREQALKVLEKGGQLPTAAMLRCRVRYFTDGAILGSNEVVRGFAEIWQHEKYRKFPPKANRFRGAQWGDLATIQGLRKQVFG